MRKKKIHIRQSAAKASNNAKKSGDARGRWIVTSRDDIVVRMINEIHGLVDACRRPLKQCQRLVDLAEEYCRILQAGPLTSPPLHQPEPGMQPGKRSRPTTCPSSIRR